MGRASEAKVAPPAGDTPAPPSHHRRPPSPRELPRELALVVAIGLSVLVFSLINPVYIEGNNLGQLVTYAAGVGMCALGVTALLIAGEFDLSIGATFALAGIILAKLLNDTALPPALCLVITLAAGAGIGLLNGLVTLRLGIPSFIVTLGAMFLWRGVALGVSDGFAVNVDGNFDFLKLLGAQELISGIRISALWWVLAGLGVWVLMERTRLGNWLYAIGGEIRSARNLGVHTDRTLVIAFTMSGVLAAAAGTMELGRFGSMNPIWGDQLAFEALAVTIIGGTLISGGVGTIIGTMLGGLMLASIQSGLIIAGAPAYYYTSFVGVVVIAAVAFNHRFQLALERLALARASSARERRGD